MLPIRNCYVSMFELWCTISAVNCDVYMSHHFWHVFLLNFFLGVTEELGSPSAPDMVLSEIHLVCVA